MDLKILCTRWGHTDLALEEFFTRVKTAGYHGVDTWVPEDQAERSRFTRLLEEYELIIVGHQHQATGRSIAEYCRSLEYYLRLCLECNPLLINSHSGRDYFTADQQLQVIDTIERFSSDHKIVVAHETHRGRIGFSPGNAETLFALRPAMKITADFSHWVCVTESYLENFSTVLDTAIARTAHTHARVGFTEGPQIPDPKNSIWSAEVSFFMNLWRRIFEERKAAGDKVFTITPEFGPPPYMWVNADGSPLVSQWETNLFIKELLQEALQPPQQ